MKNYNVSNKSQHFGGFWEKYLRLKEIIQWRIFGNFSEGVKNYNVLDKSQHFGGLEKISEGEKNN